MTRVLVLLVIAAELLAQLALGTDPILVAFCGLALVVGFFPALVFRPDLYSVRRDRCEGRFGWGDLIDSKGETGSDPVAWGHADPP